MSAQTCPQADALRVLLDGGYFWYYGGVFTNPLYPWVVAISTPGLLPLVHRVPELLQYRRQTVFLLGFCLVTFVLSMFSVSILGATHLLILLPIPQLFIAAGVVFSTRWTVANLDIDFRYPRIVTLSFVAAILVPLMARDLKVDADYHAELRASGGHSAFSSAIYTLADDLDEEEVSRP